MREQTKAIHAVRFEYYIPKKLLNDDVAFFCCCGVPSAAAAFAGAGDGIGDAEGVRNGVATFDELLSFEVAVLNFFFSLLHSIAI